MPWREKVRKHKCGTIFIHRHATSMLSLLSGHRSGAAVVGGLSEKPRVPTSENPSLTKVLGTYAQVGDVPQYLS